MKLFKWFSTYSCNSHPVSNLENIYDNIKRSLSDGIISISDVEALAELTTELAARTKEADGE